MPSLLDHIDRFSFTAQAIQTSCQQVSINPVGPYVRAVLHTRIGDKARDVDESEIGLFTLVMPSGAHGQTAEDSDVAGIAVNEVARVEFPGATPLRKPTGIARNVKKDEREPEVYAEAALKYLDKYQSIRPMPRARQEVIDIIDRLDTLRDEVSKLSDSIQENGQQGANPFPTVKDEERRIQELNFRLKQLKARKEVLLKRQGETPSTGRSSATALHADDSQEDAFWSEPATGPTKPKARQSLLIPSGTSDADESLLLDAKIDMNDLGSTIGDMSLGSISDIPTPLPPSKPPATAKKKAYPQPAPLTARKISEEGVNSDPNEKSRKTSLVNAPRTISKNLQKAASKPVPEPEPEPEREPGPEEEEDKDDDAADEGEKTIVLRKPPSPSPAPPHSTSPPSPAPVPSQTRPTSPPNATTPSRNTEKANVSITATPAQTPGANVPTTPATERKKRPVITTEVERIVAKIWSTVGDVIMPGHPFNTASAATTNKPPKAKETIALLENISSQQPSPSSPSTHSTLSLTVTTHDIHHPTAQQILMAHLLVTLLNSPEQSLPLSKAKEVLAARGLGAPAPTPGTAAFTLAGLGGGGQGLENRALYACVAKRLLKIDRGTREQTVKFNV